MESKKRSAYDEAVRYLTGRMRTVSEMRRHLEEKGYDRDEVSYVVSELVSMRYLDDRTYAMVFFERGYDKRRGSRRMKRELIERGIPADVIDNAYEDFLHENNVDEFETALGVARLVASEMKELGDKEQARIARKLSGLGYSNGDIYKVLSVIRSEAAERTSDEDICDS